jgi:hypothetical protein
MQQDKLFLKLFLYPQIVGCQGFSPPPACRYLSYLFTPSSGKRFWRAPFAPCSPPFRGYF